MRVAGSREQGAVMTVPVAAESRLRVVAALEREELAEARVRGFDLLARRVAVVGEGEAPAKGEGGVGQAAEGSGGAGDAGGVVAGAEVEHDARVVPAGPRQGRRVG